MRRGFALLMLIFFLAVPAFSAPAINFDVYSSTLNKFAAAVGPLSGDAGHYDVDIWTPFGNIVVYSADLYWTLSNTTFQITPQGISFTGQLNLSYYKFSYTTNVTGSVTAAYQQSPQALVVSIGSVSVPVQFSTPIGNITLTTLTVNPQYSFSVPVYPAAFSQPTASGVSQMIYGQIASASVSYQNGYIEIATVENIW
jgi:hypothetical protein